jgi:hypothetical protein
MKKFLDLGMQPLANRYLTSKDLMNKKKEVFYHLEVGFDKKTKLVSILNKIPSQKMFDNNYPYRSSMSKTMTSSFKKLSKKIKKIYNPKLILEIGSNDGSLIKNFNKNKVICVEPCKNLAIITKNKGYKTYAEYWNIKLAKKIKLKHGFIWVSLPQLCRMAKKKNLLNMDTLSVISSNILHNIIDNPIHKIYTIKKWINNKDKTYFLGAKGTGNWTMKDEKNVQTSVDSIDCSGAICKVFSFFLEVKKVVSFFKNNHINRCLSRDSVEGDSAFFR